MRRMGRMGMASAGKKKQDYWEKEGKQQNLLQSLPGQENCLPVHAQPRRGHRGWGARRGCQPQC